MFKSNKWMLLLLSAGLAVGSAGCLIATSSQVHRDGSYVSEETLHKIEPGKTDKAWIVATLGEPTERDQLDPGHEVWKYAYKETRSSSGYVFLIFGGSDHNEKQERVFVEMKDGIVAKSWRG